MMSGRQQQAAVIAGELSKMGAFVLSPLPLNDVNPLRFQILQTDIERILPIISGWGWNVRPHSSLGRVTPKGLADAMIYELDLPRSQQPMPDRTIRGDVTENKQAAAEVLAMQKHLGLIR